MNRCFICQSDNPQKTIIQFFNLPPKTKSFFILFFHMNWIFQHSNTPFFLQIGAFFQNLILKVISEMVGRHLIVSMNFLQIQGYSSLPMTNSLLNPMRRFKKYGLVTQNRDFTMRNKKGKNGDRIETIARYMSRAAISLYTLIFTFPESRQVNGIRPSFAARQLRSDRCRSPDGRSI